MLSETATGELVHMDRVAYTSMALLLTLPWLLYAVESRVKAKEALAR